MKTVVYITKNKIWAGKSVFEWNGVSFDEVFGKIKKISINDEIRIVLGNDVSFVTSVKVGDFFVSRENVLKVVKSYVPFEIYDECFDWKNVVLASKEEWIQVVAVEKELLLSLSSAVLKHGVRVDLITSISILLGEKTKDREIPVVIKWNDKEKLSVLAVDGLTDLVVSEIPEEDLMTYAIRKWRLAVNPEIINISEEEFDLSKEVFSEKIKGEDSLVLNLPIMKQAMVERKTEDEDKKKPVSEKVKKKKSNKWIYFVILIIVLGIGILIASKAGLMKSVLLTNTPGVSVPSISPISEETVEPIPVDLNDYYVQVLNGGGVTGEAAKIKKVLIDQGFEKIDIGNTTATTEGMIRFKNEVPKIVLDTIGSGTADYKMGISDILIIDSKYDLIIVLGSNKNTEISN